MNTYHIEKTFSCGVDIVVNYSECVNCGTIKVRRKGAPNLKWTFEEKTKAKIDFEFIKKFVFEFLFKDTFNKDEIIEFMEKYIPEVKKS